MNNNIYLYWPNANGKKPILRIRSLSVLRAFHEYQNFSLIIYLPDVFFISRDQVKVRIFVAPGALSVAFSKSRRACLTS